MSWNVLHVRPRCEKKVAEFCRIDNISHYLPLRAEQKVYQRRKVNVTKPLFPGYLFAKIDAEQRLALLKTNNILRTIPPLDSRQLVRELVYVRRALRSDPNLETGPALEKGTLVRIHRGPFAGIEGTVTSIRARTRVMINVEMVGQAVVIEARGPDLEVAD